MNVAFIPVRGGSKSIPLKNIKKIAGHPLVYWTTKAAVECDYIDKVYVSTDSDEIKNTVIKFGFNKVDVIDRSIESATDTASTEFAMLEFAEKYNFDNIVLIQATSPLLTSEDLNNGFEIYNSEDCDSVLSAVKQKRFCWNINNKGIASSINYDVYRRPRRQDFDGYYVENGAFYITSKEDLIRTRNRISGNIKIVPMCDESFLEIDEPSDWNIIEKLLSERKQTVIPEVKMFLTDCDGCLTDGGMYYSENGDELKKFNTKDGMGFKILQENNIITGVITGENTDLNKRRFEKLKTDEVHQGVKDKLEVVKNLCEKYNISLNEVVYIGDDINDIDVINAVGFSCCPSDAIESVKKQVDYVAKVKGGDGVIREIVELLKGNV